MAENMDAEAGAAPLSLAHNLAFAAAGAADSDVGAMSTPGGGSSIASPNGGYRVLMFTRCFKRSFCSDPTPS